MIFRWVGVNVTVYACDVSVAVVCDFWIYTVLKSLAITLDEVRVRCAAHTTH